MDTDSCNVTKFDEEKDLHLPGSDDEYHDCESDPEDARPPKVSEPPEKLEDKVQEIKLEDVLNDHSDETAETFQDTEAEVSETLLDDFVDEVFLKESESVLTAEQLEVNKLLFCLTAGICAFSYF